MCGGASEDASASYWSAGDEDDTTTHIAEDDAASKPASWSGHGDKATERSMAAQLVPPLPWGEAGPVRVGRVSGEVRRWGKADGWAPREGLPATTARISGRSYARGSVFSQVKR